MWKVEHYTGFARVAIHAANLVTFWPDVLAEIGDGSLTLGGILLRFRQEFALANGATLEEVYSWVPR